MKPELNSRERILRAMQGQEIDRLPWCPFLAYYWESLSEEAQKRGQLAYIQAIGADPLMRGSHQLYTTTMDKCEIVTATSGSKRLMRYETAVGALSEEYSYSPSANSWFLTKHPVSSENDFLVLQYIYENMQVAPNPEVFERDKKVLGDGGLYLPTLGTNLKTAFQSLVEHWCGTVDLTYALCDFSTIVEECLDVMRAKDRETVKYSLDSTSEAFIFWEDSSTTNISPDYFMKYTAPEVAEWAGMIHGQGKLLIHHACGHIRDLVVPMSETGVDMIESISPPPTGNITLKEAAASLPNRVGLIGGIEPTFFLNSMHEELQAYVQMLISDMKGKRFILANSDSCPPGVQYEKFVMITNLLKEA